MRTLLGLTAVTLLACAPPLVVQGRPVDVQTPKGVADDAPLPMLVLLHGYSANAEIQNVVFPFSGQVDAKGFRYVLPNGTVDASGKRFWNATDFCCNFGAVEVDDVAFLRAVIEQAKARYATTKVYVLGHSNGAFMGLRLACEAPDAFDALVAVSGAAWLDFTKCPDGKALPIALVHGDKDDTILYEGVEAKYPSAHVTAEDFARRQKCTPAWAELGRSDFVGDATEETRRETLGCTTPLELWTVEGAGHVPAFDAKWTGFVIDWLGEKTK